MLLLLTEFLLSSVNSNHVLILLLNKSSDFESEVSWIAHHTLNVYLHYRVIYP